MNPNATAKPIGFKLDAIEEAGKLLAKSADPTTWKMRDREQAPLFVEPLEKTREAWRLMNRAINAFHSNQRAKGLKLYDESQGLLVSAASNLRGKFYNCPEAALLNRAIKA